MSKSSGQFVLTLVGIHKLLHFLKKHMIFAGSIMLGGNHVTRDISLGLQVPISVAEKIKTKNGGLIATGLDDRDLIEVGGETGD